MTAGSLHPARLPWFAAGTLEPMEASAIEQHLRHCPECRDEVDALRSMTRTLRAFGPRGHVAPDRLVAYQGAGVSPEERARVADHLESCPACRADLRALERAEASLRTTSRRRMLAGAAASLLVLALAGWQVASWRAPAPTATSVTLTPTLRGATIPTFPAGPCVLKVLLPPRAPEDTYVARVELPGGRSRSLGTVDSKDQWVTLHVRQGLGPGPHVLLLAVRNTVGSGEEEEYTYDFDVRARP